MPLRVTHPGPSPAGSRWVRFAASSDDGSLGQLQELVSRPGVPAVLDLPGVLLRTETIPGTAITAATLSVPRNVFLADIPGAQALRAELRGLGKPEPLRDPQWLRTLTSVLAPDRRFDLLKPLRTYQREALHWLVQTPAAILGDDMGLGKTLTAIRAAELVVEGVRAVESRGRWYEQANPHVLVLAPKALRGEWRAQLRQWSTDEATRSGDAFFVCEGTKADGSRVGAHHRWVFCHYDILPYWYRELSPLRPAVVIADEAHALKTMRTKRRQAAQFAFDLGWFGWLLTGTPILNRLTELHSLYDLLSPWSYGSPSSFRRHYLGASEGAYGLEDDGPRFTDELNARVKTGYLARKKRDVGMHLPPLTRALRELVLADGEYEDLDNVLAGLPAQSLFEALLRGAGGPQTARLITRARQLLSRAKAHAAIETAIEALDSEQSVIVFSSFRDTCVRIAKGIGKAGFDTHYVSGALTQPQREAQVDAFRAAAGPRALVATYDTLAVGWNLQKASVGVFNDLPWTPAHLLQAEARYFRGGQTNPCTSYWLVARRTIDDLLLACLTQKGKTIDQVLRDGDASDLTGLLGESSKVLVERMMARWLERRGVTPAGEGASCP